MVNGTPSATPLAEPMLRVMSERTTPSWVRMFGPLEPSPGNGPAVSSGMGEQSVDAELDAAAVVADVPAALVDAPVVDAPVVDAPVVEAPVVDALSSSPQPTTAMRPAPASRA